MNMPPRPMTRMTDGIPKPKRLGDYPSYIAKVVSGFFKRLFYIFSLVWESAPWMLILLLLLCLVDGILPVVGAYISKDLLNVIARLIGKSTTGIISDDILVVMKPAITLLVVYFVYLFLKKIITRVNSMVTSITGELVSNHIRMKIINKSKTVDIASFDRPEFYEKLENANREAGMRPLHILTATFNLVSYVISTVSFIGVLAALSPIAPVLIICAAVPGAAVNYVYRTRNYRYMRRHSKERRQMNYYSSLMTDKNMAKELRILGLGDTFAGKYSAVFKKYYIGLRRLVVREGITQVLVGLVSTAVTCTLFLYVAYEIVFGNGEIGDYSLYTGALTSISGYVTQLIGSTSTIYEGTLFINNMMDFMDEEITVTASLSTPRKINRGERHTIEFENVSFRYPGTERDVIENLSIKLETPDSVVLVGLNGAGKTTFIKLLTRLYDPTSGRILFDGYDIKEYEPKELYDLFGIIFQDFGHYAESAAENIRLGDVTGEHDSDDVVIAAKHASADEFISELPRGYDTPLSRIFEEDGIELSGGQWQKLSVARAFYKSSDILILDEPTASLDAIAEREVFDRFSELSKDKLTIFVSHRLSSAVGASKIIVLDRGRAVEVGTHEELIARGGVYHELFTTQAQRYIEH